MHVDRLSINWQTDTQADIISLEKHSNPARRKTAKCQHVVHEDLKIKTQNIVSSKYLFNQNCISIIQTNQIVSIKTNQSNLLRQIKQIVP